MSYRSQYSTRSSAGRYNNPGHFVSAGEMGEQNIQTTYNNQQQYNSDQQYTPQSVQPVQQMQPPMNPNNQELEGDDVAMDNEEMDTKPVPHWMKSKQAGGVVKKLSMKERRRRQNENLRRLLTPKNALMVLNEMMPNKEVNNQFKVEPAPATYFGTKANSHNFCADLTVQGNVYKGFGDNKLSARNAAAEQAIRDMIIKRISKACQNNGNEQVNMESEMEDESSLPMIQLASFALHKLFTEWEYDGHKVPALRPQGATPQLPEAEPTPPAPSPKKPKQKVKKPKVLPTNASAMHPCMLLTYMRPALVYRELLRAGEPPNQTYTMAVDVDGITYVGKASNKKEARREAAISACQSLFNVTFEPNANESVPQH